MNRHGRGEDMNKDINKVAGYRVMIRYSQKDAAKYLDISPQSYSNKERGHRNFNDVEKNKLKILFSQYLSNITIDDLFF